MAWGARNLISTQVEMAPTTTSVKTCANVSDGCHASITSGSLDDLRAAVKHACGRSDVVLAASYSRKTLGQTGDGRFLARRRLRRGERPGFVVGRGPVQVPAALGTSNLII